MHGTADVLTCFPLFGFLPLSSGGGDGDGVGKYPTALLKVSALLEKSLSKRLEKTLLTNKGIYIDDTDASYALLVHQVRACFN